MVTEGGRCTGVDSKRPACSLMAAHTALLASSALSTWWCKNRTSLCHPCKSKTMPCYVVR